MLAARIELSDQPVYELFTGLPGTGVTTEIRRLAARLNQGERPWLTVRVDAGEVFDEQVAAGHQAGEAVGDLSRFALDDRANLVLQGLQLPRQRS